MNAAVIGGVFSLGEKAVLLDAGACVGNVLSVLVGNTFATLVILFTVFGSPPVAQVAVSVELASLIVEAVDDFMSNDHADGAQVHGVVLCRIEERRLQNASREVDGI